MTPAPLLRLQGVVKRFGGLTATDHATLDVLTGEVHALIGPNGAGKTTLIHQISGAMAPDAGRIEFDGRDVTGWPMDQRVLGGLARSYQITSIFRRLSVLDNLALAVQARSGSSLRLWARAREERERYEQAAAVAQRVGLGARLGALAGALAHGEQRQLEVGLALATRPKLLLLDEPMAGMGHEDVDRIAELIRSVAANRTILMVEHNLSVVASLSDTITVLARGRVLAEGDYATVSKDPRVVEAYIGVGHG